MSSPTIHLIANAHLDPVWLWDWREGLNEGIITVRTILDLMDADAELTFIRGEAAVYQHIEQHDPITFERIRAYVAAGRWDVVGGTHIQPDTNLPATETFARHFERAQHYFRSRFGKVARVAWAADSFGHSAGLPEILAASGIEGYAFSRPGSGQLALAKTAFWWEGPGGSRVLAYRVPVGWYGCERAELLGKLDACLQLALQGDIENIGCVYGVGNHGGGPTRRHLAEIRDWKAQHPEIRVLHSGLHALFDALREEVKRKGDSFLPTHRGELNYCLRGCYSSLAKFKFAYRKTEAALSSAERTNTVLSAALYTPTADLGDAWDAVLFNSFHDILPGSSIERAYDDQLAWLGGALHQGQRAEIAALNALARRVDTRVPTPEGDHPTPSVFLVWNPHPRAYRGHIELEASLDYRPIWAYVNRANELPVEVRGADREPLPFQLVATEHNAMVDFAWRKRAVLPVELPPFGWSVFEMAWQEPGNREQGTGNRTQHPITQLPNYPTPNTQHPTPATAPQPGVITNDLYTVQAQGGEAFVRILRQGKPIFTEGGLSAITVEDPWGSWGGMAEEPESLDLSMVRHEWTVADVRTLETGPERATLWVRLTGGNSRLDLTFSLYRGRDAVDVGARVFWNERAARLKLVFPVGDQAEFEVPGGSVQRGPAGEVPGGRWVRVESPQGRFGFASDALYNFDCKDGVFRATVARAGGYATDVNATTQDEPWRPAVDAGELRFRFLLTPGDENLPVLARELEEPPVAIHVPSHAGDLPRSGSFASLAPASLRVLALKPAEDSNGWILRLQETAGISAVPELTWMGERVELGEIGAYRIVSWRLVRTTSAWVAHTTLPFDTAANS